MNMYVRIFDNRFDRCLFLITRVNWIFIWYVYLILCDADFTVVLSRFSLWIGNYLPAQGDSSRFNFRLKLSENFSFNSWVSFFWSCKVTCKKNEINLYRDTFYCISIGKMCEESWPINGCLTTDFRTDCASQQYRFECKIVKISNNVKVCPKCIRSVGKALRSFEVRRKPEGYARSLWGNEILIENAMNAYTQFESI